MIALELQDEETARVAADEALRQLTSELTRRAEVERAERDQRARAKAAQNAVQNVTLQRELRTLQRQLVYPTPSTHIVESTADGGADALWAALLADSNTTAGGGLGHVAALTESRSLSYAPPDDHHHQHDSAMATGGSMPRLRQPALGGTATPVTRAGPARPPLG